MCKASQPPNQSHWPGLTLQGYFLGAVTSRFYLVSVKAPVAVAAECRHAGATWSWDAVHAFSAEEALVRLFES